ncbi:MAG: type ISP restriction/modification enzyme [Candidatus Aminicenantaceae bacterium]
MTSVILYRPFDVQWIFYHDSVVWRTADKRIDKIRYDKKGLRLYINNEQYFEGVKEDIWEYRIGGYQVCNKWLKDRKGKILSVDEVKHYCKVVTAMNYTIKIQNSIDKIYEEAEKELIGS